MKQILRFLLVLIFFLKFTPTVFAQELPQVVFINHIRGNECCSEGSYDLFVKQIHFFQKNNLPVTFALRHDALIDEKYQQKIAEIKNNPLFNFGIMLEITPKLTTQAGVEYQGNKNDWYQAQYAFTIGYSSVDKKKIIDSLVNAFKNTVGYYPKISTAWMTDTESINYLKEKYNLTIQQVAREQIGLDSYTLDGGPPHYPYLGNKTWFFTPNSEKENTVLILRHTVADPFYEYGDTTSAFTSQANDYVLDGKDFSYFKKLIDQTLFGQSTRGYANLGLENSMTAAAHDEFFRQITYLKDLAQNKKIIVDSAQNLNQYWSKQKVTIYQGIDLVGSKNSEVFWLTTPSYRIRLKRNQNNLFINDLRIYKNIEDPYLKNQAISAGYLITPALIKNNEIWAESKTSLFQEILFKNKIVKKTLRIPTSDLEQNEVGLILPKLKATEKIVINNQDDIISLSYQDQNDKTIKLIFSEDGFSITGINQPIFNLDNNFVQLIAKNNSLSLPDDDFIKLTWQCGKETCVFLPENNVTDFLASLKKYQKYLLPDPGFNQPEKSQSQVFLDNDYALAAINPIRIVFSMNDNNHLPATLKNSPVITTTEKIDKIELVGNPVTDSIFFIDLYSSKPIQTQVDITLADLDLKIKKEITFAPLCSKNKKYCLTHPRQTFWYLKNKIKEKIRSWKNN